MESANLMNGLSAEEVALLESAMAKSKAAQAAARAKRSMKGCYPSLPGSSMAARHHELAKEKKLASDWRKGAFASF